MSGAPPSRLNLLGLTGKPLLFAAAAAGAAYLGWRYIKKFISPHPEPKTVAPTVGAEEEDFDEEKYHRIGRDFIHACVYLRQFKVPNLSNDDKLTLYALYKVVIEGECTEPEPSFWDFEKSAKHAAWKKASQELTQIEAMEMYVRNVDALVPGWREHYDSPNMQDGIRELMQTLAEKGKIQAGSSSEAASAGEQAFASKPKQWTEEEEELLTEEDLVLAEGERDDDGFVPTQIGEGGEVLAVEGPRTPDPRGGMSQGGATAGGLREIRGGQMGSEMEQEFVRNLMQQVSTALANGALESADLDEAEDSTTLTDSDIDLLQGNIENFITVLKQKPELLTKRDMTGSTLLHHAVDHESKAAYAQALLEAKADVNATDAEGSTPLQSALWSVNAAGALLLLEHGADATVIDSSQNSTLGIFDLCFEEGESPELRDALERALHKE